MVSTAVVTPKGQLVIPALLRKRHGIKGGTRVCFLEEGDSIVLKPMTPDYFQKLAGILGTEGKGTSALLVERAKDRVREDRRR